MIYDWDARKPNEDHDKLRIRTIPQQKNRKVKKGIENLFPDHLFTEEFYLKQFNSNRHIKAIVNLVLTSLS